MSTSADPFQIIAPFREEFDVPGCQTKIALPKYSVPHEKICKDIFFMAAG